MFDFNYDIKCWIIRKYNVEKFISQYSGEDPDSIISILSIGLKNFANYISSCFEYIKNLF